MLVLTSIFLYGIMFIGDYMYIQEKLQQLGFKETTPIQDGVFKVFSSSKHLVGLAPTGTGKTHAYLLPILANLQFDQHHVQAVVIVPTNELVIQVEKMLKQVEPDIRMKAYYGSMDKQKEYAWLSKQQPQFVISTPQKLYELVVEQNLLKIHTANFLVLDEADMMMDYAFLSIIDQILPSISHAKLLLFSATISKELQPFIKKYFGQYDLIDTSKSHQLKISHQLVQIKIQSRLEALSKIIQSINPYLCFIFVSKKENQEAVFQTVLDLGLPVVNLNSSLGVKKRKSIIDDIHQLKYQYVVTSDLAARGLDFKISHVIQFDLPHHLEFFFHRSGRTGRMYDDGIVITLAQETDSRKIDKLKKQGIHFDVYQLTNQGLNHKPPKKKSLNEEELAAIRKVKKPTKVTPNYKKKNKALVTKAKKEVRRKQYAKNR